ncbi:hypothetical protein BsWGS_04736 [Bradybaena similaris]
MLEADYHMGDESENRMSQEEPPCRCKKRPKSAFATGTNSTYNVQNLRVTNKCLALRLSTMRERLLKVLKHNMKLRKQNGQLKDQLRELKQNPMVNKFTDIKEYIEDLKNKIILLKSITTGAAETVVGLSQMCLPAKSTETGALSSLTSTVSSIPCDELDASVYQSTTDAAGSVTDESAFKMAFPDGDRASLRQRPVRHMYYRQKLCLSSSEDVSALTHELTQTSKSASSAYVCGNELNYFETFRTPDARVTAAAAQYQQRQNNDSALKYQTLQAWMETAKCHDHENISDNEMIHLKSVNSCDDEQQQSGYNIETVSSNSRKLPDLQNPPVKQNLKRKIGRRHGKKQKSKTNSPRKETNPVIIPYTGNLKSSKTPQTLVAQSHKKSPLSSGKIKLKKSDDINPMTNQALNRKLSPPAKAKTNAEFGFSKSNSFKMGGLEHTMKAPLCDGVASRVPKSQKFRKDKMCLNISDTFPKPRLKLGKQKTQAYFPFFLNEEKQKHDYFSSMRTDELNFPLCSYQDTNETLSNNYKTFSVDKLSKNNCTISTRKIKLGENLVHGLLKDNSNSVEVDSHSKLQAHATRRNDCEDSNIETNEVAFDTVACGSSTFASPTRVKVNNPQCAEDDFPKRCIENSADNVKQNALSVTMSTDCRHKWVITKSGLNSAELRKYTDFKQSENEQDVNSRKKCRKCPVKDATVNKYNQNSKTQKQINILEKNKGKSVLTSIPGTNTRKAKYPYTRPHSAMLETERSFQSKEMKREMNLLSCPNTCKINNFLQKVKRPHSVGCSWSKTKLFDYERITKTKPSTRAKSPLKPINMPHDERQQMNIRGKRNTTRGRLVTPCLPINETYPGTPMKSKRGTRSMSPPGTNREMCHDSLTESLAMVSIETHERTQTTATIESRERQNVI